MIVTVKIKQLFYLVIWYHKRNKCSIIYSKKGCKDMNRENKHEIRAAIYIRVSTKLQEDRYSLSSQKLELTKYANDQGWLIVDTFKDVDSGGKLHKAGLEALLDCVDEGKVDVVLCVDQDRLSRLDTLEWEYLKQALRENNVKIAEPGTITDLANEDDEFISDIKNLIAKREKRSIVRRMTRGLRQYTREGKIWGRQPDEYVFDKITKKVKINEAYAWVIPFIDELYLKERLGFAKIANRLNEISNTPNGKKWSPVIVYSKLINPVYHGILQRKFSNGGLIEVEDVYPPLRSKETYIRIRSEMKRRHKKRLPGNPHFLRDIEIRCAECGHILSVSTGSSSSEGSTKYYLNHSFKHSIPCNANPSINTQRFRKPLTDAFKSILDSEESAQEYLNTDFSVEEIKDLEVELKKAKKALKCVNEKMDKLIDLYLDGNFSKERLDERKLKLENESLMLKDQIQERERKIELMQSEKLNYEAVVEYFLIVNQSEALLSELDKQRLFGSLFPTATYYHEREELVLHAVIQNVTLDVTVPIEAQSAERDKVLLERAKKRYKETQNLINSNPGINFKKLVNISPYNAETIRKDIERFGWFDNLPLRKGSPELKAARLKQIRTILKVEPSISIREMSKRTGICESTTSKLMKEIKYD